MVEDFKYLMSLATVLSLLSSRHSRSPSSDQTILLYTVLTLLSEREESLIVSHTFLETTRFDDVTFCLLLA